MKALTLLLSLLPTAAHASDAPLLQGTYRLATDCRIPQLFRDDLVLPAGTVTITENATITNDAMSDPRESPAVRLDAGATTVNLRVGNYVHYDFGPHPYSKGLYSSARDSFTESYGTANGTLNKHHVDYLITLTRTGAGVNLRFEATGMGPGPVECAMVR
jgi:hypothetical protein